MALRSFFLALAALFLSLSVLADEQINSYDVVIDVETDGDIMVTETINVTVEGRNIRRGIFRDLPRYFEKDDVRYEYDYDVRSITRNGRRESYERSNEDGAVRLRIGEADVLLNHGEQVYELRYRVKNQIRYFESHDEIYWNVTGSYWKFPITKVKATINFPEGSHVQSQAAYTGAQGDAGGDYTYSANGNSHVFETTAPLNPYEGMTVSVGIKKGLIDPPSASDNRALLWQRYGALGILIASLLGLLGYYYRSFDKVGRDPPKPPVFARYDPPEGYSPAAVHHIYYRIFSGHSALIATLMNLAVKKWVMIDVPDKETTVLTKMESAEGLGQIHKFEGQLLRNMFDHGDKLTLGDKYNANFTVAYSAFKSGIAKAYGKPYFLWNMTYVVTGVVLSATAVLFAVLTTVNWSIWHTLGVLALAALNGLFMYLMPAPTRKGQKIRTEIDGFKLYLETAEKLQLNAVEVGSEAPPPMTTQRYERFLPYAVALGVEKPWTKHFERLIPDEAKAYNPGWTRLGRGGYGTIGGMNKALVGSINSGVTSSLPQSSGSSGSGGGGFSGGGGGGGGGGGW